MQSKRVLVPTEVDEEEKPKGAKQLKRAAPLALEDQKVDKKETAKKATAVKAKASKPEVSGGSSQQGNSTTKPMALENQPTPGQASKSTLPPPAKLERCKSNVSNDGNGVASAVDACLNRQDTANLNKTGKGIAKAAAAADPDPSEPDSSSSENESENGENPQDEQDLEKVLKQKESRARYMRFYRSLRSKRTPLEVRRAGAAAYRQSDRLQVLLEQWLACSGQWKASEFYYQARQKKRSRRHGCRKWLTRSEIATKYGSFDTADGIIAQKMRDPEISKDQIRCHPDMHGQETDDTRQYLVWDQDGEEETTDLVTQALFQAADTDENNKKPGVGQARKKKSKKQDKAKKKSRKNKKSSKKRKAKSTSDSESDESSKSSSSSSSSEKSSESSEDSSAKPKRKGKKQPKTEKNKKLGQSKKSKDPKDQTEEDKEKAKKKQEEIARKAEEKRVTDAHKKECRKGEQAIDKLTIAIHKTTSLQGGKLSTMSQAVQDAIFQEMKPQAKVLKSTRTDLQSRIDSSQAGDLDDLTDGIATAQRVLKDFGTFLKSYNLK
ncbi:unnamed protein product [Cladocopium goreaui]|uniref:Neurofilament heavy polypeptide n=1 Tax=Cladocopium goreaui TaxID=2562237 RepID=A0A9P1DNG5_9DINO|nr:unnamed protein product [Cladocopium goreaui]